MRMRFSKVSAHSDEVVPRGENEDQARLVGLGPRVEGVMARLEVESAIDPGGRRSVVGCWGDSWSTATLQGVMTRGDARALFNVVGWESTSVLRPSAWKMCPHDRSGGMCGCTIKHRRDGRRLNVRGSMKWSFPDVEAVSRFAWDLNLMPTGGQIRQMRRWRIATRVPRLRSVRREDMSLDATESSTVDEDDG